MSFAFPKSRRLQKNSDIRAVLRFGKKISVGSFLIKWKPRGADTKQSRFCFMVRKKDVKTAVRRNRAKRLVREFFRLYGGKLLGPVDMVVQIADCKILKYNEIEGFLKTSLKQAGILR